MPFVDCQVCSTSFYVKPSHQKLGYGKYCSVVCKNRAQCKGKTILCTICKKEAYKSLAQLKHSKSGNFFCSKSCQTRWRNSYFIEEKHPNWQNGIRSYRKILSRINPAEKCSICEIKDKRVLIVHHIDHNRQNNNQSNLLWVCLNCHHLIHNFDEDISKFIS